MAVKVRPYRGDTTGKAWEVDIAFDWLETGEPYRSRFKSLCSSERASLEWGEKKQAGSLRQGPKRKKACARAAEDPRRPPGLREARRRLPHPDRHGDPARPGRAGGGA
jgi:hypothetical protein